MKTKIFIATTLLASVFVLSGCAGAGAQFGIAAAQSLALMGHSEQMKSEMGGGYDYYASQRGAFFSKCLQEKGVDAARGCQATSETLFPLPKAPEQINFVTGTTRGLGRIFGSGGS